MTELPAAAATKRYDALLAQTNAAIDQVRAVAKWMIAAIGAVASLLVAGVQLSSIGKVSHGRAVVAGVMVCIVIAAAAAAIMKLSAVLLPQITTRDDVVAQAQSGEFAKFLSKHTFLLGGHQDAKALADAQRAAVKAAQTDGSSEPTKAEARRLTDALNLLVPFGSYFTVRTNFSSARTWTLGASIVGGLAIVAFARSVGATSADSTAPSTAAVHPSPTAVTMRLSSVGVKALQPSLGKACAQQLARPGLAANAIATGVAGDAVTIIVVPRGDCRAASEITITPDMGQVAAAGVALPTRPSSSHS